jgi:hypothetical protein
VEPWTIRHYARPFLQAMAEVDGRTILLRAADDALGITCESPTLAAEVAHGLDRLRNPDDALWDQLKADSSSREWLELLERLDERSFVSDAGRDEAAPILDRQNRLMLADIGATIDAVVARVPSDQWQRLSEISSRVLNEVDCLLAEVLELAAEGAHRRDGSDQPVDVVHEPNFYVACLTWQARYMRHAAPLALLAVHLVLVGVLRKLHNEPVPGHDPDELAAKGLGLWLGGIYSDRDVRAELTSMADLLTRSTLPTALRLCPLVSVPDGAISGIALIHKAERMTRAALQQLGEGRFVSAVRSQPHGRSALMVGCYVEEYHVTCRFVEILTPLLRKRLAPPLRQLMFRYYSEEVGHEAFERATCLSLGVPDSKLQECLPLPLHVAFVDVLTELADTDPIGFMASVMVTEGMLGEPAVANDLLASAGQDLDSFNEVSRQHERLNTKLNHSSIARLLLSQVKAVAPSAQLSALASLLFVVELNYRAWDSLCDFYGTQLEPELHGWLSCRMTNSTGSLAADD